jgi:hypothetical protein
VLQDSLCHGVSHVSRGSPKKREKRGEHDFVLCFILISISYNCITFRQDGMMMKWNPVHSMWEMFNRADNYSYYYDSRFCSRSPARSIMLVNVDYAKGDRERDIWTVNGVRWTDQHVSRSWSNNHKKFRVCKIALDNECLLINDTWRARMDKSLPHLTQIAWRASTEPPP